MLHIDERHLLQKRLALREGRRHRRAWLDDIELPAQTLSRAHFAIVLMAPDHQIQKAGQHLLVDARLVGSTTFVALVPVLVQYHDVEPLLGIRRRLEADLPRLKGSIQALVADVAEAVKRDLRPTFAHKHRLHHDVLQILGATEVVDEAGDFKQVCCTQVALAARVVVVPVDHEHRKFDVHVGVLIVDHAPGEHARIADHLKADIAWPQELAP
mmetsp:Transcript_16484/g.57662  ORF Transcript_16484/g.57662 Transcript_16484/m.57662 type:complete len:213 (+) Transcript_16484:1645-2283(+)